VREQEVLPMSLAIFDQVVQLAPEGLTVHLQFQPSKWTFRFFPTRDPEQPRFWCLVVDQCDRTDALGKAVDRFLVARAMPRDQLLENMARLREDPREWLGADAHQNLTDWLTDVTARPMPEHPIQTKRGQAVAARALREEDANGQETPIP
jgi:hypothetical protein